MCYNLLQTSVLVCHVHQCYRTKDWVLCCVQGPEIQIQKDHLSFKAHGSGARGANAYAFTMDFYLAVDPKVDSLHSINVIFDAVNQFMSFWIYV